jgi:hypothetical protein
MIMCRDLNSYISHKAKPKSYNFSNMAHDPAVLNRCSLLSDLAVRVVNSIEQDLYILGAEPDPGVRIPSCRIKETMLAALS